MNLKYDKSMIYASILVEGDSEEQACQTLYEMLHNQILISRHIDYATFKRDRVWKAAKKCGECQYQFHVLLNFNKRNFYSETWAVMDPIETYSFAEKTLRSLLPMVKTNLLGIDKHQV